MTATYMVICSYICFLLDFLVSALLSDCKGADIQVAAVAVNNKKLQTAMCYIHFFMDNINMMHNPLNETMILLYIQK